MKLALLLLAGCCAQAPQLDPNTEEARLLEYVTYLCEIDPPRAAEHPESCEKAAAYIEEHLEAVAPGRVSSQVFEADGMKYRNVSAFFGPEEGPRLVIGAHYDVCHDTPGADDNASAVAVMIELARSLSEEKLAMQVELVAYPNEEPPNFGTGDMGSARHAKMLKENEVEVHGMLVLEMLGYYDDEEGSQNFPVAGMEQRFGTKGDFLVIVGRPGDKSFVEALHAPMNGANDLRIEHLLAPRAVTGVDFSDHRNYWDAGFTAAMLTDTAFLRNPHYHERTDTPETLDYERMAQARVGVLAAVKAIAGKKE